jgi:hypothetical protein
MRRAARVFLSRNRSAVVSSKKDRITGTSCYILHGDRVIGKRREHGDVHSRVGRALQGTTAGTPTPALSLTGTLPVGVTLVGIADGTASLGGTPAAGTGGTYSLTLTATDSVGSATQAFTLTVQSAPF